MITSRNQCYRPKKQKSIIETDGEWIAYLDNLIMDDLSKEVTFWTETEAKEALHAWGKERRVVESRRKKCVFGMKWRRVQGEREVQIWLEGQEGLIAQSLRGKGPAHGGYSVNTCEMIKCGEDLTVDTWEMGYSQWLWPSLVTTIPY